MAQHIHETSIHVTADPRHFGLFGKLPMLVSNDERRSKKDNCPDRCPEVFIVTSIL